MESFILDRLKEASQTHAAVDAETVRRIAEAAAWMGQALESGNKIIWCGNGGSATQSQHMAGEFVGRYRNERRSLPSISLTENIASVTAIANDYSFEDLFARQLEGLGRAGDVLVGISTSGNSANVLKAFERAEAMGIRTVGLTGASGGRMRERCACCICVPSKITARIQEVHLTVGHILCEILDERFTKAV